MENVFDEIRREIEEEGRKKEALEIAKRMLTKNGKSSADNIV